MPKVVDVYLDDSDTLQSGGFVCLAAYAMSGPDWREFAFKWYQKAMQAGLPHGYLHTSDFLAGKGLYRGMDLTMEQRLAILKEMLALIHSEVPLAIGVTVDARALANLLGRHKRLRVSAEVFCLIRILKLLEIHSARLNGGLTCASIICDYWESATRMLGAYRALKKKQLEVYSKIAGIAFVDDRFYQPLQCADLFACLLAKEERREYSGEQQVYGSLRELLNVTGVLNPTQYAGERHDANSLKRHESLIVDDLTEILRM